VWSLQFFLGVQLYQIDTMHSFIKSTEDYCPVPSSDVESNSSDNEFPAQISTEKRSLLDFLKHLKPLWLLALGILLGLILGIVFQDHQKLALAKGISPAKSQASKTCLNPSIRREWRSLSRREKDDYIAAVRCLAQTPSEVRSNGTLYDDFPWIHSHVSHISEF
jgi:hypothetical protein